MYNFIFYRNCKQPNSHSLGIKIYLLYLYYIIWKINRMYRLEDTTDNRMLVQEFIDETKWRLSNGVAITFTHKASLELQNLVLDLDIAPNDIEFALMNLKTKNYYRGIDPSPSNDFNVCAFCVVIGELDIEIYLKFGLELNGIQILVFSNHLPKYTVNKPF